MYLEKEKKSEQLLRLCNEFKNVYINNEKIHIPFLVLVVGQACSLKCKDCANFSPYAPERTKRYNLEDIKRQMIKIYSVATIDLLQIQGGEPFVYSELLDLLNYLPANQRVRIATNGTIIPSGELLNYLRFRRRYISVRISDYGVEKYLPVKESLLSEFRRFNIAYDIYSFTNANGTWNDMGGLDMLPLPQKKGKENYKHCSFGRNCLTLENGVIGYCSRATIAPIIQNYEANKNDLLYLDEIHDSSIKKELFKYVYFKHAMRCCQYCYGAEGQSILPAIQL